MLHLPPSGYVMDDHYLSSAGDMFYLIGFYTWTINLAEYPIVLDRSMDGVLSV